MLRMIAVPVLIALAMPAVGLFGPKPPPIVRECFMHQMLAVSPTEPFCIDQNGRVYNSELFGRFGG
jgi:hypothetical protein